MGNVLPTTPKKHQNEEEGARELGIQNDLKQTEVNTLVDYYKQKDPDNLGLLPEQFREAAGDFIAKQLTIDPILIFNIFDRGVTGRVTLREFILGYAILCRGSTQGRLRYLFSIYRPQTSQGFLTKDQLTSALTLIKRIVTQISDASDSEDDDETKISQVADELLQDSSVSSDSNDKIISYDDFIARLRESEDVTTWLDKLSDVAGEHLKFIEQCERDIVDLNMEREGILHSDSQASTPADVTWTRPVRRSDRPSTELNPPADKKRRIPLPKKQKIVRRDLQSRAGSREKTKVDSSQQDNAGQQSINPAEPFIINYDQITFHRVLGRGACATVYECEWLHVPVAVKVFRDGRGNAAGEDILSTYDEQVRRAAVGDYVEEFWLLLQIRHPNCLLYMGICFEPVVCIVTELFSGGSVSNFLHGPNRKKFTPEQALEMLSGVARAMYYLHASTPAILHRDLKASNILINKTITHCVICDFGLSKQFVDEASGIQDTVGTSGSSESEGQNAGTPYTMAPEVMDAKPYTPAADVYSFGIVMYEMYTGRLPFGSLKPIQLMFQVVQGFRPPFRDEDDVPPTLQALIKKCWAHDQHQRPSFGDILEELTSDALKKEIDIRQAEVIAKNAKSSETDNPTNNRELSKQLLEAAYRGKKDMVASLISNGADVNYTDYDERTALHIAAAEGRIACIRILIGAKARLSLDRWGNSPVVDASNYEKRTNDSEPYRLLCEYERSTIKSSMEATSSKLSSPKRNQFSSYSTAAFAAANGDITTIRKLLEDGFDVNSTGEDQKTVLMIAAAEGHCEIVTLLLEKGADVAMQNRSGSTAHSEAEHHGHTGILQILQKGNEQDSEKPNGAG